MSNISSTNMSSESTLPVDMSPGKGMTKSSGSGGAASPETAKTQSAAYNPDEIMSGTEDPDTGRSGATALQASLASRTQTLRKQARADAKARSKAKGEAFDGRSFGKAFEKETKNVVESFGEAIDASDEQLVAKAADALRGNRIVLPVAIGVMDGDGGIEGAAADGKIYLSRDLAEAVLDPSKRTPAKMVRIAAALREELGEAAYQKLSGGAPSTGDFGAEVAARSSGSWALMAQGQRDAIQIENDMVEIMTREGLIAAEAAVVPRQRNRTVNGVYQDGPEGSRIRYTGPEESRRVAGNGGDDAIYGDNKPDDISVGDGDDIANGRGGDDVITSGEGDNVLNGGPGNDKFIVNLKNSGRTIIDGGPGTNTVRLIGVRSRRDVRISKIDNVTVIRFNGNSRKIIVLKNIQKLVFDDGSTINPDAIKTSRSNTNKVDTLPMPDMPKTVTVPSVMTKGKYPQEFLDALTRIRDNWKESGKIGQPNRGKGVFGTGRGGFSGQDNVVSFDDLVKIKNGSKKISESSRINFVYPVDRNLSKLIVDEYKSEWFSFSEDGKMDDKELLNAIKVVEKNVVSPTYEKDVKLASTEEILNDPDFKEYHDTLVDQVKDFGTRMIDHFTSSSAFQRIKPVLNTVMEDLKKEALSKIPPYYSGSMRIEGAVDTTYFTGAGNPVGSAVSNFLSLGRMPSVASGSQTRPFVQGVFKFKNGELVSTAGNYGVRVWTDSNAKLSITGPNGNRDGQGATRRAIASIPTVGKIGTQHVLTFQRGFAGSVRSGGQLVENAGKARAIVWSGVSSTNVISASETARLAQGVYQDVRSVLSRIPGAPAFPNENGIAGLVESFRQLNALPPSQRSRFGEGVSGQARAGVGATYSIDLSKLARDGTPAQKAAIGVTLGLDALLTSFSESFSQGAATLSNGLPFRILRNTAAFLGPQGQALRRAFDVVENASTGVNLAATAATLAVAAQQGLVQSYGVSFYAFADGRLASPTLPIIENNPFVFDRRGNPTEARPEGAPVKLKVLQGRAKLLHYSGGVIFGGSQNDKDALEGASGT